MVIVIAEGACNFTLKISKAFRDLKIGAEGKDASGNVKYSDVGSFFAKELSKYCKEQGLTITLKYIDPSYMIRAVPANAQDSKYCT